MTSPTAAAARAVPISLISVRARRIRPNTPDLYAWPSTTDVLREWAKAVNRGDSRRSRRMKLVIEARLARARGRLA